MGRCLAQSRKKKVETTGGEQRKGRGRPLPISQGGPPRGKANEIPLFVLGRILKMDSEDGRAARKDLCEKTVSPSQRRIADKVFVSEKDVRDNGGIGQSTKKLAI